MNQGEIQERYQDALDQFWYQSQKPQMRKLLDNSQNGEVRLVIKGGQVVIQEYKPAFYTRQDLTD